MRIGFVIYQGMTLLDFAGVYDPVTRLESMDFMPDLVWELCAFTAQVKDNIGLEIVPTKVGEPLDRYDIIIVPGGFGSRKMLEDENFIQWLKTAEPCPLKASVCTGSLLLGKAGFLRGKKATTHPFAFVELSKFCSSVVDARIVDEGDVITARGVSSSIDLGLYLCEKLVGEQSKEAIRRQIDYQ